MIMVREKPIDKNAEIRGCTVRHTRRKKKGV